MVLGVYLVSLIVLKLRVYEEIIRDFCDHASLERNMDGFTIIIHHHGSVENSPVDERQVIFPYH